MSRLVGDLLDLAKSRRAAAAARPPGGERQSAGPGGDDRRAPRAGAVAGPSWGGWRAQADGERIQQVLLNFSLWQRDQVHLRGLDRRDRRRVDREIVVSIPRHWVVPPRTSLASSTRTGSSKGGRTAGPGWAWPFRRRSWRYGWKRARGKEYFSFMLLVTSVLRTQEQPRRTTTTRGALERNPTEYRGRHGSSLRAASSRGGVYIIEAPPGFRQDDPATPASVTSPRGAGARRHPPHRVPLPPHRELRTLSFFDPAPAWRRAVVRGLPGAREAEVEGAPRPPAPDRARPRGDVPDDRRPRHRRRWPSRRSRRRSCPRAASSPSSLFDQLGEDLQLVDELLGLDLRLGHRAGGDEAVDHQERRLVVAHDLAQEGEEPLQLLLLERLVARHVRQLGADPDRVEERQRPELRDEAGVGLGEEGDDERPPPRGDVTEADLVAQDRLAGSRRRLDQNTPPRKKPPLRIVSSPGTPVGTLSRAPPIASSSSVIDLPRSAAPAR